MLIDDVKKEEKATSGIRIEVFAEEDAVALLLSW